MAFSRKRCKEQPLSRGEIDDAYTFFNGKEVGGMKQCVDERIYTISKEFLKVGDTIAIKITDTGSGGGLWDNSRRYKVNSNQR